MTVIPGRAHGAYLLHIEFLSGDYEAATAFAEQEKDVLLGVRAAWQAAALAHLGRKDEAAVAANRFISAIRADWFATETATDEAIVRWLLHLYPINRRGDWARLRDGLRLAGLPTGGAEHHGW
jgi:hypothetical protein